MNRIHALFTPILKDLINVELQKMKNPIFVFVGVQDFVDLNDFVNLMADKDTFCLNGNETLFNKEWFMSVFALLMSTTGDGERPYILSYAQFSYLTHYIKSDFFASRIVLIQDGLRTLYPIHNSEYVEQLGIENIESRPESMPIYMAEQIKVENSYFYSIKTPTENYTQLVLCHHKTPLTQITNSSNCKVIDTSSDPYGLDCFINECLNEHNFNKEIVIKHHIKQPHDKSQDKFLLRLNWVLHAFKGELKQCIESDFIADFTPSYETLALLKLYWGESALFRELGVYKNPDCEKTIVPISQGLIVETIITEYKKGKRGDAVKDLFLTAPTGSGKSLLFQLPAFYASAQGDVTVIVSPLIALMKDQVNQIRTERKFDKVHYLNSELSLVDRDKVIEHCKKGKIDILYLSPELLLSYDITFFIGERHLGLLVIDEAHLITTWGRDFRVDYWFLGQYINKIRKMHNFRFPMVAVTATAIYGGDNDMVFDSISSLYMHDPYLFIGEVKRNDITFVIDNHELFKTNYDTEKERETANFVHKISESNVKTLIYVPYKKHIDRILQHINSTESNIAVSYHAGLDADVKNWAYQQFRENKVNVMIATKAFGMGVDIPDIQVVYHHAVSGLLPDYVQEIGRVARKKGMKGFAALSYAVEDQKYSKILYGMSSIKRYQIRETLKKIYKIFKTRGEKRNLLVSTDDFSYIFNNNIEVGQKIMTILMMIEKDYLAKYRYNVLIARPKKMFVKVYARTNLLGLNLLKSKYIKYFTLLSNNGNDQYDLSLDLDEIWQEHFYNQSFPLIKKAFYDGELFKEENIVVKPLIKVSYTLESDFTKTYDQLIRILDLTDEFFAKSEGAFWRKEDFLDFFTKRGFDKVKYEKIIDFILSAYSGKVLSFTEIEKNAFLQRRRTSQHVEQYRTFNRQYKHCFATLKNLLSKLFKDNSEHTAYRYVTHGSEYLLNYIKLGSLLELMGCATYETRGGDNPMIFIRINDPQKIYKDINDTKYENMLLRRTYFRHTNSCEIFDHFFMHSFENQERWDFIEDFFLGTSTDELLKLYPGGERNHIDIVEYIKMNIEETNNSDGFINLNRDNSVNIFIPNENEFLDGNRMLTINNRTLKVNQWLIENPVALDKMRRSYKLRLSNDVYDILISKLRNNYFPYFRDSQGLNLRIEFKGYQAPVPAQFIYDSDPVAFYKWWKKNQDKVMMNKEEL